MPVVMVAVPSLAEGQQYSGQEFKEQLAEDRLTPAVEMQTDRLQHVRTLLPSGSSRIEDPSGRTILPVGVYSDCEVQTWAFRRQDCLCFRFVPEVCDRPT